MLRCLVVVAVMAAVGLTAGLTAASEVVHLTTQDWPPYQMLAGDRIDGVAVRVLRCVFGRLGVEPQITMAPWLRAQQEVREGRADGFFVATENAERNSYATLSAPIVPETRRWYWRHDRNVDVSDKTISVAAQGGTVMHEWLIAGGYTNVRSMLTTDDLIHSLENNTIDAALANQLVFDWSTAVAGIPPAAFRSSTVSEVGLGIYFRNRYLAEHPGLLQRFNDQAADCRLDAHLSSE